MTVHSHRNYAIGGYFLGALAAASFLMGIVIVIVYPSQSLWSAGLAILALVFSPTAFRSLEQADEPSTSPLRDTVYFSPTLRDGTRVPITVRVKFEGRGVSEQVVRDDINAEIHRALQSWFGTLSAVPENPHDTIDQHLVLVGNAMRRALKLDYCQLNTIDVELPKR